MQNIEVCSLFCWNITKSNSIGGYKKCDARIFAEYRLTQHLLLDMWEQKSSLLIAFTGFIKLGELETQETKMWQNKTQLGKSHMG